MSTLKMLEQDASRIELGKGSGGALGSLIGIIIFGVVACVGLLTLLEDGGGFNPVAIVIFLIVGIAALTSLRSALLSTRVVVDTNQRLASRTDSFLLIPFRSQHMAFNLIREVQLANPLGGGAISLDSAPGWKVSLVGSDGSSLLLNDRGYRAEMQALADQVGSLVGRPVRGAGDSVSAQPAGSTPYTVGGIFGSLAENLTLFAQSLGEGSSATVAPPFSAFPSGASSETPGAAQRPSPDSPYAQASARMAQKQVAAGASSAAAGARMAQDRADAFASDAAAYAAMGDERAFAFQSDVDVQKQMAADQLAAGVPFNEASARLAQQQAEARAAMGFSMPAMLSMPEMPALASFGPALDMPSFAPLGAALSLAPMVPLSIPETKQVEAQVSPSGGPSATRPQTRSRSPRNLDTQEAYLRALKANPADGLAANDLGVTYFLQNNSQQAERYFRRAIALDPFLTEPRYNLGLVLWRRGRRSDAQEQFRVGAQNAPRGAAGPFEDALRGNLLEPMTSAR